VEPQNGAGGKSVGQLDGDSVSPRLALGAAELPQGEVVGRS